MFYLFLYISWCVYKYMILNYSFSSDRVLRLITLLKNFNDSKSGNQKFCCIIFVKRRFTAKVLYHVLKVR